jgi:putative flippase GtrA
MSTPQPSPQPNEQPEARLQALPPSQHPLLRIAKYVAVGGLQFVLDVALFYVLHFFSMPVVPANILSRLTAATVGYVANRQFTFAVPRQNSYRMVAKYWLFWLSMTAISSGLLWTWESFTTTVWQVTLGKLVIDGGLCVAGFFISQKYIYTHDS